MGNRVSVRDSGHTQLTKQARKYKPKTSSHTVNRRKKLNKTAQENMAFMKKLNGTKSTYSRKKAMKAARHQKKVATMRQNVQVVQVRSKPKPQWHDTAGDSVSKDWSSGTGLGFSSRTSPRQRR